MRQTCSSAGSTMARSVDPPRCGLLRGEERDMVTILIVLVVLMLLGAIPAWPHSRSWGYGPSGGLGLILLVVVILFLTGRL